MGNVLEQHVVLLSFSQEYFAVPKGSKCNFSDSKLPNRQVTREKKVINNEGYNGIPISRTSKGNKNNSDQFEKSGV